MHEMNDYEKDQWVTLYAEKCISLGVAKTYYLKNPTLRKLVSEVKKSGSHFFDAETMDFWGDTFANFYVDRGVVTILVSRIVAGHTGNEWRVDRKEVAAWLLLRKCATKNFAAGTGYAFDAATFERLLGAEFCPRPLGGLR